MSTLCISSLGSMKKSYHRSRKFVLLHSNTSQNYLLGYHYLHCFNCSRVPILHNTNTSVQQSTTSSTNVRKQFNNSSIRCLSCSKVLNYKEDFTLLGLPETATADQIKRAYFVKAKAVHPDTSDIQDNRQFIELQNAYERLIYESKFGKIHESDPRNNPQSPEYWDLRKRPPKSEAEKQKEQAYEEKRKIIEKQLLRRMAIGIVLGLWFGTIFPALFVGSGEQVDLCVCDKCILKRVRSNPSTSYILKDVVERRQS